MKILLVEPAFPIPNKSKNHKNFLPIGLLKLYNYYKYCTGNRVKLVRGDKSREELRFVPDQVMITSLFTYWSKYVIQSVQHYRKHYPKAKIVVGGIYASLMPEHCKKATGCDRVHRGMHREAERFLKNRKLDYSPIENPHPLGYQVIHSSRGCFRRCPFCGSWKIEPKFSAKRSIINEIVADKLIFYDNNLLRNPHMNSILSELIELREKGIPVTSESQSGFDGRLLTLELARMLKRAGFVNPRIAWDWGYSDHKRIRRQLNILEKAGYRGKEIYVFMLFNWDLPFSEMEKKRIKCWEWKLQIADCRYRPLDQTYDEYEFKKVQTHAGYFIHKNWTDREVKQFRRNVRRHNICVRQGKHFYSKSLERQRINKQVAILCSGLSEDEVLKIIPDAWFPDKVTPPPALSSSEQLSL